MPNSLSPLNLLLDTHVALWAVGDPTRLREPLRRLIESPDVAVHVSVASLWEIAIKTALKKIAAPDDLPDVLQAHRYLVIPVLQTHAWAVRKLENFHGDPFDRLLVAQARMEGFTLVTHDREMQGYGVPVIRA